LAAKVYHARVTLASIAEIDYSFFVPFSWIRIWNGKHTLATQSKSGTEHNIQRTSSHSCRRPWYAHAARDRDNSETNDLRCGQTVLATPAGTIESLGDRPFVVAGRLPG
jgi:hypothetical protein